MSWYTPSASSSITQKLPLRARGFFDFREFIDYPKERAGFGESSADDERAKKLM
jgi:hypothetical protein